MSTNGTGPQTKPRKPLALATRPGPLSSLQLKLWRALEHAERLYQEASPTDPDRQTKTLNSFAQLCLAYAKVMGLRDYNTHPATRPAEEDETA